MLPASVSPPPPDSPIALTRRGSRRNDSGSVSSPPPASPVARERFTGERALFGARDVDLADTLFADGESPLKHAHGVTARRTVFEWKYPLWYTSDVRLEDCGFLETARSGPWYVDGITVARTLIAAPKTFRRCRRVRLDHVDLTHAAETLWSCEDVRLDHVCARGDYFGMNSTGVVATDLRIDGNYAFDGGRDIAITGATLLSKDAFWNCENVVVRDSLIVGEYLGWNSRNLRFENCTIESLQGLCYIDGLVLRGCRLVDTTLAFEYSTVDVEVEGRIDSVINPAGGVIRCGEIGELILDPERVDPAATTIITTDA